MGRGLIQQRQARRSPPFPTSSEEGVGLLGISIPFEMLSLIVG
jgi:hypothetical protein